MINGKDAIGWRKYIIFSFTFNNNWFGHLIFCFTSFAVISLHSLSFFNSALSLSSMSWSSVSIITIDGGHNAPSPKGYRVIGSKVEAYWYHDLVQNLVKIVQYMLMNILYLMKPLHFLFYIKLWNQVLHYNKFTKV